MPNTIRWGILGPGNIAAKFAQGLRALPDAELAAIGSRSIEKAQAFAGQYGAPRAYGSYEELAGDDQVDIVYVATPHPFHAPHSRLCLEAGRAVLCEKPFCINEAEAQEVVGLARGLGRFLMEAMWTRFLPVSVQVRDWIAAEAIGEPRMITADFGFRAGLNPTGRLFDPALGGGGLLDVGVYPIAYACMIFGAEPAAITGAAHLGETGVDEQAGMVLAWPGGELAVLSSAVRTNTPQEVRIDGTDGRIRVPSFWHAETATLEPADRPAETINLPFAGNGYEYQAAEAMRCLRQGRTESDVLPLDETLAILRVMDTLRGQWGLRYPME